MADRLSRALIEPLFVLDVGRRERRHYSDLGQKIDSTREISEVARPGDSEERRTIEITAAR